MSPSRLVDESVHAWAHELLRTTSKQRVSVRKSVERRCTGSAIKRVYVEERVFEDVVRAVSAIARSVKLGPGLEP